jgi:hypothetical protein
MSTRLDQMIGNAQDLDTAWDVERSERVRAATLRRRDVRVRRDRALRRGLLVAGGAGLIVLTRLRAASSAPPLSDRAEREITTSTASPTPIERSHASDEALAARSMSDAGYARD